MMSDFEEWNNDPVNRSLRHAPPDVERILSAEDRRREWRQNLLIIGIVLIAAAIVLWLALHS